MGCFKASTSPLKRLIVASVLGSFGFYLLLFGLAVQQHANKMKHFEKSATQIYARLTEKNRQKGLESIPSRDVIPQSEGPSVFDPGAVFCVFFCERGSDAESLKHLLVSFKDDLSNLNFSGIDLSGRDTDFSGANFSEARLRKSNFATTNLKKAIFRSADLREARFSGANLQDANLSQADLSGADLRGASLAGADLRDANFFYADFLGADLSDATLSGVKLSGADFRKVNFLNADLGGATLSGARLDGANMKGARLDEADLRYADLSETTGLTQEMLSRVMVDENTRLPEGLVPPEAVALEDSH